jgi:hypothetical protein
VPRHVPRFPSLQLAPRRAGAPEPECVAPFADSALDNVDQLRERDHIDSAEATVRVVSVRLSTDTTFAGVRAIRAQLVTGAETVELCGRTLSADEQKASSVSCDVDHVMDEPTLRRNTTAAPARTGVQLDVSGAVTATKLSSVVTFEVEVNVDASLCRVGRATAIESAVRCRHPTLGARGRPLRVAQPLTRARLG